MAPRTQIPKEMRKRIAKTLAKQISEIFQVPIPVVYEENRTYERGIWSSDPFTVVGQTGEIDCRIQVSSRLVTVFMRCMATRYDSCTTEENDLYRLITNPLQTGETSGKINFHLAPSDKVRPGNIESIFEQSKHHFYTACYARLDYEKLL